MSFTNKSVLVTGASSGIGASIALLFTKEGANVAIIGRNETKLKNVAEQCAKNGNKPLVIKADVSNDDDVDAAVKKTIDKFGKLDILVNNAGFLALGTIFDGKVLESYDEIMKVNMRAVIKFTTQAAPLLAKTKGNIVNISSVVAAMAPIKEEYIAYNVSKAALDHFSRGAAVELSKVGVRVNIVSPGPVATDFLENASIDASWDSMAELTLLNRVSHPQEIADLVLFLASDKAKGITGSTFISDNGTQFKK